VAGTIAPLSTVPEFERSFAMQTDGLLLRIFIGESDRRGEGGELLYKMIVNKAREAGLKGATVLRGSMGFGANSVLHTAKVLEMSSDLPIVIEIVDERAKIEGFLPFLEGTVSDGMITMEDVRIVAWKGRDKVTR
jgi:PII-like signaling protein